MKKMKKSLLSFMVLCFVLVGVLLLPTTVQASSDGGTDGEIEWKISGDTLTLSAVKGTQGRMKDYSNVIDKPTPWGKSSELANVKKIIIKDGVTQLSTNAFSFNNENRKPLKLVSIAGTVETIPEEFFYAFNAPIEKLVINQGTKRIEKWAFMTEIYTMVCAKSVESINLLSFLVPELDSGATTLRTVYGYSGSGAEKYVKEYKYATYKTENTEEGYITEDGRRINLHIVEFDDKGFLHDRDIDSLKFIPLNKSSIFSKVKATSKLTIKKGKSATVKVTLPTYLTKVKKYSGAECETIVSYKSSNKSIATVSTSGKVTGKKKGTAKITTTLKLKNGTKKSFTTKVTIK